MSSKWLTRIPIGQNLATPTVDPPAGHQLVQPQIAPRPAEPECMYTPQKIEIVVKNAVKRAVQAALDEKKSPVDNALQMPQWALFAFGILIGVTIKTAMSQSSTQRLLEQLLLREK